MIVALLIAALILALVEEFTARGRSLVGWAAVLIAIAILVTEGVFPRI